MRHSLLSHFLNFFSPTITCISRTHARTHTHKVGKYSTYLCSCTGYESSLSSDTISNRKLNQKYLTLRVLTYALDESGMSASCPGRFTPGTSWEAVWAPQLVWKLLSRATKPLACGIHCCPSFLKFLFPDHHLYIVKNVCTYTHA
jgi:hypothetical protein